MVLVKMSEWQITIKTYRCRQAIRQPFTRGHNYRGKQIEKQRKSGYAQNPEYKQKCQAYGCEQRRIKKPHAGLAAGFADWVKGAWLQSITQQSAGHVSGYRSGNRSNGTIFVEVFQ